MSYRTDEPETPFGPRPPRSSTPPSTFTDWRPQRAENGTTLPIIYGTHRAAGVLVERYASSFSASEQTLWAPTTLYVVGDIRQSNGRLYICTVGGTSASPGGAVIAVLGHGPDGQGTDIIDNTVHWSSIQMGWRHFIATAYCEGLAFGALKAWQDKLNFTTYTGLPSVGPGTLSLALGAAVPTRPTWFPLPGTGINDIYANTVVLFIYAVTGSDADLPNINLEIQGIFADGTHTDVSPADVALDLLTHVRRGIGWPAGRVDAVSTGVGAASWRTYSTAFGLHLSWLLDSQRRVMELLKDLGTASNTDIYWTNRPDGLGSMLRFVPLGDQALTANGVTYTPNTTPLYNLGPDDLIGPLAVQVRPPADKFNSYPIEYTDRAMSYVRNIVEDPVMDDVDVRGLKRAGGISVPFVLAPASAIMLSRIRAQRSLKVANVYTFRLGHRYLLLEPTDLVTLTDPVWGITNVPVRIITKDENQDTEGSFTFTAEDWPTGVSSAAAYAPQTGDGFKPNSGTNLQILQALPGQVPPATVADTGSTRGGQVDNIFPNHTSENSPPDGADTTRPEWVGRLGVIDAFAGSYVRQLTALSGARQLLGDVALDSATIVKPAYQSQLGFQIRCSPGESFFMGSQVRFVATSTLNDGAGVGIAFLDSNKQILTVSAFWDSAIWDLSLWDSDDIVFAPAVFPSAWTRLTASGMAPAGAVFAHFFLFANSDQGQVTAQFDGIFAAKQIEKGLLSNETWTAPTFLNAWGNAVGSTQGAGFFEDLFGIVQLRGTIAGGTIGLSAFTLPVGYRPAADMRFGGDSNGAYGRVTITAAGNVIPDVGSNVAVSLDGIKFDTRN